MAVTVPRYDQGQVRHNNLPGARYSNAGGDVAGEAVGQAIGRAGDMLGQIAEAEKQKVDTAAVMEAEAALRGSQNTMLFGDGTGKNVGAFGTKGKDAFGLPEQVLPAFSKQRTEIAARLKGQQRAMFEQRTAGWEAQTQGDLLRHIARESEAYTKETTKAYIDSSAQTALLYYNDPAKVDSEINRAQDAYLVGNPGDPPEATRLALQTIDSNIRRSIVNRMMVDSPGAAQTYYSANRDRFVATDQADIERTLTPLVKADTGEKLAETLISGGVIPGTSGTGIKATGPAAEYAAALSDLPAPVVAGILANLEHESGFNAAVNPGDGGTAHGVAQWRGERAANFEKVTGVHPSKATPAQSAQFIKHELNNPKQAGMTAAQAAAILGAKTPGEAAELFDKYYERSDGKARARRVATAAKYADATGGTMVPPMSAVEAKQWALDNISDATVQRSTINRIEIGERLSKQREAELEKTMIEQVNRKVEQADPSMPLSKIVTPQELAWAQESGRVDSWENRLKQRAGGGDQQTPRDQLLAYRAVVYNAARGDESSKRELSRYNPYDPKLTMSQQDRDWLARSQADVLSGDPAKQAKAASEGEINNIVQTYSVNTLGVDKKKLGTDPAAIAFDRDMRLWADQFQRANNRAPTYTETLKQADLVTIEKMGYTREVPGKLWGTNEIEGTVAELGIPASDRKLIVEALYAEGKPVTGETVAAKWRAYLKASK